MHPKFVLKLNQEYWFSFGMFLQLEHFRFNYQLLNPVYRLLVVIIYVIVGIQYIFEDVCYDNSDELE